MDLAKDKVVRKIISRLKSAKSSDRPIKVDGTWGSFAPMLAAHILRQLKRPILYVSPHIDDADNARDDLEVFAGSGIETFPVWETQERFADATDEIGAQRLRIALGLSSHRGPGGFSDLVGRGFS